MICAFVYSSISSSISVVVLAPLHNRGIFVSAPCQAHHCRPDQYAFGTANVRMLSGLYHQPLAVPPSQSDDIVARFGPGRHRHTNSRHYDGRSWRIRASLLLDRRCPSKRQSGQLSFFGWPLFLPCLFVSFPFRTAGHSGLNPSH